VIVPAPNATPTVRKSCFSDLEKPDI